MVIVMWMQAAGVVVNIDWHSDRAWCPMICNVTAGFWRLQRLTPDYARYDGGVLSSAIEATRHMLNLWGPLTFRSRAFHI